MSSHLVLFGFIQTFEFDQSKKAGVCVNFEPRALREISGTLVSILKLGC